MKIVLTNTCALNGGDAAILLALVKVLREAFGADCEFVAYDNQPGPAARYYPELEFRRLLYHGSAETGCGVPGVRYFWRRFKRQRFLVGVWCYSRGWGRLAQLLLNRRDREDVEIYESADLIISTGGTYLIEKSGLAPRIFDYRICRWLNKPLVFFTQSIGRFETPGNRRAFRKIFNQARAIFLRDEQSYDNLRELGVDVEKLRIFPDVAFAWAESDKIPGQVAGQAPPENWPTAVDRGKRGKLEKSGKRDNLNIAVSVRYWNHFSQGDSTTGMSRYQRVIGETVTQLVRQHGAKVTFVSTCQGIPEYWADDAAVAGEIYAGLADDVRERVTVDSGFHRPSELLEMLGNFDAVIATRMHMAILSLARSVPVFPIAYEFKTRELFNQLGLGRWTQDIDTIETEACLSALVDFIDMLPEIRSTVVGKVADLADLARKPAVLLKEQFDDDNEKVM